MIGLADGNHLTVVYTDRATSRGHAEHRIISARRASRKERITYEAAVDTEGSKSRSRGS